MDELERLKVEKMKQEFKYIETHELSGDDVLAYDLKTIPLGITVERVMDIMYNHKVLFFDTSNGGVAPYIIKDQHKNLKPKRPEKGE